MRFDQYFPEGRFAALRAAQACKWLPAQLHARQPSLTCSRPSGWHRPQGVLPTLDLCFNPDYFLGETNAHHCLATRRSPQRHPDPDVAWRVLEPSTKPSWRCCAALPYWCTVCGDAPSQDRFAGLCDRLSGPRMANGLQGRSRKIPYQRAFFWAAYSAAAGSLRRARTRATFHQPGSRLWISGRVKRSSIR